jgi:aminopeptidase-like protein
MIGGEINARLWVLNLSDGEHSLLDIADRSGLAFTAILDAAELLTESGLLSCIADRDKTGAGKTIAAEMHR